MYSCLQIVIQVLQELGLLGLRIQRMPSESGVEFGIPSQYSHMTVNSYHPFAILLCSLLVLYAVISYAILKPIWLY